MNSILLLFIAWTELTNIHLILPRLSGRLDLLINQIKQNTDEDLIEDSDLLVYEDKRKSSSESSISV